MSEKIWLGGIFLKEEGGYALVLRSLRHYKKRLRNVDKAPEIKDAPMFAQIVKHEAMKVYPLIDGVMSKISEGLQNPDALKTLESDLPIFEKALNCYESDIQKIETNPFYSELISDKTMASSDYPNIKPALQKIAEFS